MEQRRAVTFGLSKTPRVRLNELYQPLSTILFLSCRSTSPASTMSRTAQVRITTWFRSSATGRRRGMTSGLSRTLGVRLRWLCNIVKSDPLSLLFCWSMSRKLKQLINLPYDSAKAMFKLNHGARHTTHFDDLRLA